MPTKPAYLKVIYLIAIFTLIWSGIEPYDRYTWILEVLPGVVGIILAAVFVLKYRITNLTLLAIALHAIILFVGGRYTYARVPLGDWVSEFMAWDRNHYDRFAHIAQGFFPAIFVREIIFGRIKSSSNFWFGFVIVSICLAFSAFYEIIEFTVAKISGGSAEDFLGTQGDEWDTQWDMTMALFGAIVATLTLGSYHTRMLTRRDSHQ